MFRIPEKDLNKIVHDLIRVAGIIKLCENGQLTEGQKQLLHGCEIRLHEVREEFLKHVEDDNQK